MLWIEMQGAPVMHRLNRAVRMTPAIVTSRP